jgi:uncharacterized membrane protein YkoI
LKQLVTLYLLGCVALSTPSFAADSDAVLTKPAVATESATPSKVAVTEKPVTDTAVVMPAAPVSGAEASAAAAQLPIDLKMAADIVIEAFGGEVVKAEEVQDESGLHFNIRIVNDGRVKDVVVDAANGDIVKPIEPPKPIEDTKPVETAQPAETVESATAVEVNPK